ncbi:MAG: hypothetical protein DI535_03650 [Citrobacter freundii]|nr:MAG: hypothetical protein DI535_03650 [Citrobacter freundii]
MIGYLALGLAPAFIFTFGYVGGLFCWIVAPSRLPLRKIAVPYVITLLLFILHKVEEREMDFFPALAELTGVPVPEEMSPLVIILYAIGACWLLIPFLIWKRSQLGYYLAWTFFCSMGLTELAHFIFPLFTGTPYGYFPGMWSVIALAPVGWWGMYRLSKGF